MNFTSKKKNYILEYTLGHHYNIFFLLGDSCVLKATITKTTTMSIFTDINIYIYY